MSPASTAAELMTKLGEAEAYIAELERALHQATGAPAPARRGHAEQAAPELAATDQLPDVTAHQQTQDDLQRNQERYHALVDALDVALCRWLPDTTLTFANEKYRAIFGIHGEAVGRKWLDFLPDATREDTAAFYRQLATAPETVSYEHPVTVDDGQVRFYHWIDTPIFDGQGELVEFQSVGLDITDRKAAEDALREKQAVLEEAQTVARLQSWYADLRAGTITISPGNEPMTGWPAGAHRLDDLIDITFSLDLPRVIEAWKNAAVTQQVDIEYRFIQNDEIRWIHVKSRVVVDAEGKLVSAVGIAQDITTRKQSEIIIHAQRDLGRIVQTLTTEADVWSRFMEIISQIADMDCSGVYLFDEVSHAPFLVCGDGVSPRFLESAMQFAASIPHTESVLSGKPMYFNKTELVIWEWCINEGVHSSALLPLVSHGQVLGCINLGSHTLDHVSQATRDALEIITAEISNIMTYLRTEEKLRSSEQRYRLLAENMRDAVWTNSLAGETTYFSPSVQRLWGYTPEEIVHLSLDAVTSSTANAWLRELSLRNQFALQTLQSMEAERYDLEVCHQNGHAVWMEVLTSPMIADGAVIGLLSSARDVTENRAMAQEIRRLNATLEERVEERTAQLAQALEELKRTDRLKDEFLAAISHELRTPLTGIIGIADALALQTRGPLNERQQRQVMLLQESGGRMLKLVNELLRYASLTAGKVKFAPQLCLLSELCALCLHKITAGAQRKQLVVACSVTPQELSVLSDVESVVSMIDALLDNAVKFTPAGGSIALVVEKSAEQTVRISVTDTGVGIAPEQMATIFHSFVQGDGSLSRSFEGVGLGLAYVGRMATALGGTVHAESEPGKGSRFTITLPQHFSSKSS